MLSRSILMSVGVVILLAVTAPAEASPWESLFSASSGGIEARVELRKSSLRTRLVRGEKIVSAHIRSYLNDGETRSTATGDYEIHCAERKAYRSNLSMDVVASDRTKSSVQTSQRTELQGQERNDFLAVMDMLCAR